MEKTKKSFGRIANESSVHSYEEESLRKTIPSYIDNCLTAFGTSLKKLRDSSERGQYERYAINEKLSDYLKSAMRRENGKNKRNRKGEIDKSVEGPLYNPQILGETLLVVKNFVQENFSSVECNGEVEQINMKISEIERKCDEMIESLKKTKSVLKENKITLKK